MSDDVTERYVYGVKSGKFIKIGVTSNIVRRLAQIRELNPHDPHLVYYRRVRAAFHFEQKMHEILRDKLVGGEWFEVTLEEIRTAGAKAAGYAARIQRQTAKRHKQGIDQFLAQSKLNSSDNKELH